MPDSLPARGPHSNVTVSLKAREAVALAAWLAGTEHWTCDPDVMAAMAKLRDAGERATVPWSDRVPDFSRRATPPGSLPASRKWLDQLRVDAASALCDDTAPYVPDWDRADMHEDFRETLIPFFDKLADLVDRHQRLRQAVEHVIADSPGTPDSVKGHLRKALRD